MVRIVTVLMLGIGLLLVSPEAAAQTCTATAPNVYFGNVNLPADRASVVAPINIDCTGGSSNEELRVCIGIVPANFAPDLGYRIYSDPGFTQVWSETVNRREVVPVPLDARGSGSAILYMHARMDPSTSSPAAGMYHSVGDDLIVGWIKPGNNPDPCSSASSPGTFNGGPFDVSVFVGGNCGIQADPIDFGTVVGSMAGAIDATGAVRATCNNELPYTIALNAGQVPGNTIANRRLGLDGAGPGLVDYQLYLDAGRGQVWGDGSVGAIHNDTGTGTQQIITVYGRVPVQPLPVSGTYRDTVTATITY